MSKNFDKVRHALHGWFSGNVEQGIGNWSDGSILVGDNALGEMLYVFERDGLRLALHERGLLHALDGGCSTCLYEEILETKELGLRELNSVRDIDALVTLEVKRETGWFSLKLPLKVYSTLVPFLAHVARSHSQGIR
ncbi:MAG TPA: hypothetical protein PKA88_26605 [Polyangiaceae bacterium]|nr:hypothetical protein [Polyangiaceae bacterium]